MDIKEIINRKSPAHYTVEELQFAVEKYIEQKKGVKVEVNVYSGIMMNKMTQFDILRLEQQYLKLMNAFDSVQRKYTL